MVRRLGLIFLGVFLLGLFEPGWAGTHDAQWKKVNEAIQKGLPQTAIKELDPIINETMKEKAYPEAIKASCLKIALEGNIQGNKPEEKIIRLQAQVAKAPKEMRPVMEAILAHWYWQYFQQNRWRFMNRTATATPPGNDILTWDLARIFAEIDKHFSAALAGEAQLKTIPIAQYDDLLVKGTMPDRYRPTLFDFLAFEALNFYSSAEQAGARPEDVFELTAESPIFAPVEDFLAWEVKTTDAESQTVRAIRLYQKILKFHQNDKDPSAFLDASLERLHFGNLKAVGEEKNARYKVALKRFVGLHGEYETSAQACYFWAAVLNQENDLVEARRIAIQGNNSFPDSVGGKQCFNLIKQIEARSVQISTERVWNEPWPAIEVRYRNITQVHFRLVRDDWTARLKARGQTEWLDDNERKALLAKKPDREWSADLPATKDYRERTEQVSAAKDLKPGFYYLLASPDAAFTQNDNPVSFASLWVSNLALVMRTSWGDSVLEGFVLEAGSGNPIANAEVQAWCRINWNNNFKTETTKTDQNGLFRFQTVTNSRCLILANFKDQQLATTNEFYTYVNNRTLRPSEQTIFFTDRSLYRPGQTIQYKGLCLAVDQEKDNYKTIAHRR